MMSSHRLESNFKRAGASSIKYLVIDSDFDINDIRNDFESYSRYLKKKKSLVLNIAI